MTAFYGTYIGNDRMLIKTAWGLRLIASCSDMSLMPTLMVDGIIESGLTNWLIKNQAEFKGKKVIDVGANIGYFTTLLACVVGKEGQVIAYEANPDVYKLLQENIYLSQLHETVDSFNKAVADDDITELTFNVSTKYQGNSSIMEHSNSYRKQFATDEFEKITVEAEPLDFWLGKYELIKIDVEGAEHKVLAGARGLIGGGNVKHIVFELNKNMLGDEGTRELYRLCMGYKDQGAMFYLLQQDGETVFESLDNIFTHDYIDNILIKFY